MPFNMLPPILGGASEPAAPTFETTEWQLAASVGDLHGGGIGSWSNVSNVLVENDSEASIAIAQDTSEILTVRDFNFSLPAGAILYGFDMQMRWRCTRSDLLVVATDFIDDQPAFVSTISTRPPAPPAPSSSLRTDSLINTSNRPAVWFFDSSTPLADINGTGVELYVRFTQPDTAGSSIFVAWIKARLKYLMPATGNTLVWSSQLAGAASDQGGGDVAWTNPGNVTADDGSNAVCNVDKDETCNLLRTDTYGHAIPSTAIPVGIVVDFEANQQPMDFTDFTPVGVRDGSVTHAIVSVGSVGREYQDWRMTSGGTFSQHANGLFSVGSFDPTFIANFTPTIINSSGFGTDVQWAVDSGNFYQPPECQYDFFRTRVLYSSA